MKRPLTRLLTLLALGLPALASAADYTLDGGAITVHAPDAWSAIMQKTEGDPQFVVFQVPNPEAPGTLARIGVRVTQVDGATGFKDYVTGALATSRRGQGFKELPAHAGEHATLRFHTEEEGVPQEVRKSFFHHGDRAVEVSCVRPLDAKAGAAWLAGFRSGCDAIAKQLERVQ